jgi:hypothetical protein
LTGCRGDACDDSANEPQNKLAPIIFHLPMELIQRRFNRLYNKPCWGLKQGYSSMLFLEFGEPHLRIREPCEPSHSTSALIRRTLSRRSVWIRGDWRLTIFGCDWGIFSGGREIATNSSRRPRIAKALVILNGQALVKVSGGIRRGDWIFEFDLGATLETRRCDRSTELWSLSEPSGYTFSVNGEGRYRYTPPGVSINHAKWKPIPNQRLPRSSARRGQTRQRRRAKQKGDS